VKLEIDKLIVNLNMSDLKQRDKASA